MNGYRVTESGDLRVTESSDSRVTEGFYNGEVSLSGSGTLASIGRATIHAFADLNAVGSNLFAGERTQQGASNLTGEGTVTPDGDLVGKGEVTVSGEGSISSAGTRVQYGFFAGTGTGSVESSAGFKFAGAVNISGSGTLVTGQRLIASGKFESVFVPIVRITEAGDTRITESGDTRNTEDANENAAYSNIVVAGTKIQFDSELYVKHSGSWKIGSPSVKYNNEWVVPIRTYRYMNNRWKRIQ